MLREQSNRFSAADAPAGAAQWAAVERRDAAADGRFWCCVKTTKIYCRPSCPARPHRENVFFVDSRAEAETAGYRPCKRCKPDRWVGGGIDDRLSALDWARAEEALAERGWAPLGALLSSEECSALIAGYGDDARFRSTVTMGRHGFGAGEYRYYNDNAPALVVELRAKLYERLVPAARGWSALLGRDDRWPASHVGYRRACAKRGQKRPTPLILKYGPGDYNRLHRDLYGEEVFPFQAAILLSEPGRDFEGGEFVLTEQRPRMQSRAEVLPLRRGDAVVFAVNERPAQGAKGVYRAQMRHGVATVRRGARYTLGVIFHDAT